MKKNQMAQTELNKKASKALIWGTLLKVLLPGTGIGSLVCTASWVMAADDIYHNPENYPVFNSDSYRMLAESSANLENEIKKFVDSTKEKIDQIRKDEGESQ